MTDEIEDQDSDEGEDETSESESEALIDILSGQPITASAKNRLVQNVVRQLLESYGFDRADVKVGYRLTTAGRRGKSVDIAIVRHGQEARDENVERIVVCQPQKVREKLRSPDEAVADLRKLHEKLDLLPACHLGLWTNGHEDFFVQAYAFIRFYEAPLPGIGVSFSNLVTDQAHLLTNVLEVRSFELVWDHLDQLWSRFVPPDAWSILANLLYWLLLLFVGLAKTVSLAVVAFGLIASAVCALVGPLFVPFFIVPKLDWLFWSWFKAFIQYSFIPVIAFAFLMIFERFLFGYLTTLPPGITEDHYLVYGVQALVVMGVFVVGILLVPSMTNAIFSGRGGESVLPSRIVYW